MMPGETIATGAAASCGTCGVTPQLEILTSGGGANIYIGTRCKCGPYSRESDYLPSQEVASQILAGLGTTDPTKIPSLR